MTDITEYMKKSHDELLELAFSGDELAQDIISVRARKFAEFQAQVDSIAEVMDKEYTVRIKGSNTVLQYLIDARAFYGGAAKFSGKYIAVKIDWTCSTYFRVTTKTPLGPTCVLRGDALTQLPEVRKMRALWKYWSDAKKKLERA